MAALGAAAGAFQGDMEREAAAARRAQLGLQAQRMNQDAQQFNITMRERQAEKAEYARQREEERRERFADKERAQANADRTFALQERKFGQDVQNTAFEQQRLGKQDAWADALNEQKIRENEEAIAFQKERFAQFKTLAEQERQTIAERKRLAQTALASAMKIGMESGGVVPLNVVQAVAKETGIPFQGMYFAPDGSFVTDVLKDNKVVQEVTPANVQAAIMRSMPGVFGDEAAKDLMTERRDRAQHDYYLQREKIKSEHTLDPKTKIQYTALYGELRDAKRALRNINPQDDPEGYKAVKDEIDSLKNEILALEGGVPAPSGAQGGGAVGGYTEQQRKELGVLNEQAWREANGDKAKAFDIFKQKKKQWELSQVNPAEQSSVHQDVLAEHGSKASLEKNDVSLQKETDRTQRRTGVYDTNGSRFGRKPDFGSSSRNAHSSASSTLIKNESNTDLSPEDKKAMTEIFYESLNNPIDPVTRLPIDPVEYRRMKEAEYFKAKRDGDQKRMKELFGL